MAIVMVYFCLFSFLWAMMKNLRTFKLRCWSVQKEIFDGPIIDLIYRIDRQRFIKLKYHDRCYIQKIQVADAVFCDATRELDVEKAYR